MIKPFSIILLCVIGYIVAQCKSRRYRFITLVGLTMAIQINSFSGYFVKIAGKEIEYFDVMLFLTVCVGLLWTVL